MHRPIHFEIPADQPERAMKFYKEVFGWKFDAWPGTMPYWMTITGVEGQPGINGGLMNRMHPQQQVVTTIDVENVDAALVSVQANGGNVTVPKFAVPTIGWCAYFIDTEGNSWGAIQMDAAAK